MAYASQKPKVFKDPVHGHIELHQVLVSIIDTPQFQRLRYIKQMGMVYYVFPGASHNRFEHSIGVSYLAGKFARKLQSKQEELGITDKDILCVQIAGLCHDLGHGPFSHLFDDAFLPKVTQDCVKHEDLSVKMFEYMLDLDGKRLRKELEEYGLDETDIEFIKEQIVGPKEQKVKATREYHAPAAESSKLRQISEGEILTYVKTTGDYAEVVNGNGNKGLVPNAVIEKYWSYNGRDKDKGFLYEIVSNKRNGIDVDKFDYFARDSLNLGIPNTFDYQRYIKLARVIMANGEKQICVRDKELTNIYYMFHARYRMRRLVCEHGGNKILEDMVGEALKYANDHLLFLGENGEVKMSDCISDMKAYTQLTDHVLWQIYSSPDPNLAQSKEIIDRIFKRELFVRIGCSSLESRTPTSNENEIKENEVAKEIHNKLKKEAAVALDDIIVHVAKFSYGMGKKDPVKHLMFYSKEEPDTAIESSKLRRDDMAIPKQFSERSLRVCVTKTDDQIISSVKEAFKKWCEEKTVKCYSLGDSMQVFEPEERQTPSEKEELHELTKRRKVQMPHSSHS